MEGKQQRKLRHIHSARAFDECFLLSSNDPTTMRDEGRETKAPARSHKKAETEARMQGNNKSIENRTIVAMIPAIHDDDEFVRYVAERDVDFFGAHHLHLLVNTRNKFDKRVVIPTLPIFCDY